MARHKKKKHIWIPILIALLSVILIIMTVIITPMGNQQLRKIVPNDTPMDTYAKSTITKKLNQVKSSNKDSELYISNIQELIDSKSTSELIEISKSEDRLIETLQINFSLDNESATVIAQQLSTNEHFNKIMNQIEQSDWGSAKNEFTKILDSNILNEMKESMKTASENDAESLQKTASELFRK